MDGRQLGSYIVNTHYSGTQSGDESVRCSLAQGLLLYCSSKTIFRSKLMVLEFYLKNLKQALALPKGLLQKTLPSGLREHSRSGCVGKSGSSIVPELFTNCTLHFGRHSFYKRNNSFGENKNAVSHANLAYGQHPHPGEASLLNAQRVCQRLQCLG